MRTYGGGSGDRDGTHAWTGIEEHLMGSHVQTGRASLPARLLCWAQAQHLVGAHTS